MIRQKHPRHDHVFRLFNTKEEAIQIADLARRHSGFYDEVPVSVLSGWVLVDKNRTKEIRDQFGSIMNIDIIKEIEQLYHEQY